MQPQWHVLLMLVISRRNLAILPMRIRAGEHRLREGTVRFVGPRQSIRALCVQGMDGLCLSAVDIENK